MLPMCPGRTIEKLAETVSAIPPVRYQPISVINVILIKAFRPLLPNTAC
jgi:hypothetical protein